MKNDRSRFLVLATSIAAATTPAVVSMAGCVSSSTSTSPEPGTAPGTNSGRTDATTTSDSAGGDSSTESGAACLANEGPAPVCDARGVEGVDGGTRGAKCVNECSRAVMHFKSDVAKAVNDCLEIAPRCDRAVLGCVDAVLPNVCDDPTSGGFCKQLIDGCIADAGGGATSLTQEKCVGIANALNESGREAFKNCVTNSFCESSDVCADWAKQ